MPSMPARYLAQWADRQRYDLMVELGGRCANCGAEDDLEFDHPNGRSWDLRVVSRWTRIIRYRREAREGNLRLLCKPCNGSDGARARWRRHDRAHNR